MISTTAGDLKTMTDILTLADRKIKLEQSLSEMEHKIQEVHSEAKRVDTLLTELPTTVRTSHVASDPAETQQFFISH